MYCPNCAAPINGTKFCRSCGANVSLVPQALTGQLPEESSDKHHGRRRGRRERPPSIGTAVNTLFTGIGFLVASFAVMRYAPQGSVWGWCFLIPAFACLGEAISQYLRLRERQQQFPSQSQPPIQQPQFSPFDGTPASTPPTQSVPGTSAPTTSELGAPPSVTEHTTKHLDASNRHE